MKKETSLHNHVFFFLINDSTAYLDITSFSATLFSTSHLFEDQGIESAKNLDFFLRKMNSPSKAFLATVVLAVIFSSAIVSWCQICGKTSDGGKGVSLFLHISPLSVFCYNS